jgi:hypothetical protein
VQQRCRSGKASRRKEIGHGYGADDEGVVEYFAYNAVGPVLRFRANRAGGCARPLQDTRRRKRQD